MVRREVVEQVGLLDECYFMYSEELDWCYRIKQAGWKVAYLPAAQVVHHEGQSSAQDLPHRHIRFQTSKLRFFRKHHGFWPYAALRWFILATYLFQMVEEGLKLVLGHKRALRRDRLGTYWRVVRSGLRA
jgi:GT2 family glycosyltransferase